MTANEENAFPIKFDEAGNMLLKKTEVVNKVEKLEEELEEIINEKEVFPCQYEGCDKEWKTDLSRKRHESWCPFNPNGRRSYKKSETEVKNPEKAKVKLETKSKVRPKENKVIKELREFDKTFGLTDEQIVKYIRKKMGN